MEASHMKRFFLSAAILILVASIAAPVSACVGPVIGRKVAARGTCEVKLRARAESIYDPCIDCGYGWWVEVGEVIEGPPTVVGQRLLVYLDVTIAGPCSPGGEIDWSISPGDELEAFGQLWWDPSEGWWVSLCGLDGYHLRRVAAEVRLRARADTEYSPCVDCGYGWWVDVIEVIQGPPTLRGQRLLVYLDVTIAGPCSPGGEIDWRISPGDEVQAFGLLEWHPYYDMGLHVSLCGSDDYYLSRITTGPTLTPTPTPTQTRGPTVAYRAYIPVIRR
jgi:hypothetical protein